MPSPFPGMNPYFEHEYVWQDFHQTFIPVVREHLVGQVRPNYLVKLDEYHELPADQRRVLGHADLGVTARGRASAAPPAGPAIAAPIRRNFQLATETERHAYVEVRDKDNLQLITVIELLSPSNKRNGSDREQYLAKREELFKAGVSLVEIDLLRGGPRLPVQDPPPCDYCVMVSSAGERPEVGVWPISVRQPLPTVPVPLRSPDPPAMLDLQRALHRTYDSGAYEDYIYEHDPQPPLSPEDVAWAGGYHPLAKPIRP